MLGAAADNAHGGAPWRWRLGLAFQDLGIAEHRVERRAQLVGKTHHITALGLIGSLRLLLRPLQRGISLAVGGDLVKQQHVLARTLLLRHFPAVMGEHKEPSDDPRDHAEDKEDDGDRATYHVRRLGRCKDGEGIGERQDRSYERHGEGHRHAETAEPGSEPFQCPVGEQGLCQRQCLRPRVGLGLAQVMTARIQRAAERTDRRRISGAPRHILRLEGMLADRAGDGA